MRRRAVRVFAMIAAAAAAACGDGGLIGVPEVEGTYALLRVNGVEVPALFYENGSVRVDILSGTMTLEDDGTYAATHSLRQTQSGQSATFAEDCAGTYTVLGGVITFNEERSGNCGGTYAAALSGDTFTIRYNETFEAVYSR